jgi:uncharacterized protein
MNGFPASIFLDRHREIRPIWRILMFITLLLTISFALLVPLQALPRGARLSQLLAMVLAVIAASWIMTRAVHRKPFGAFGLTLHPSTALELLTGLGLGVVMMAGIFVVELATGMAHVSFLVGDAGEGAKRMVLGGAEFFLAASLEELLFRGYLFQVLIQWVTLFPAVIITAILFALAHGFNPGVGTLAYVNIALISLTLSLAYYKTRGLWLPIGLHFGWNFAQTMVFGFPTSGLSPDRLAILELVQSGPEWLTGGVFGPEGGVLATIAILTGTWFLLKTRHIRPEEGMVTLDSLEDLLGPPAAAREEEGG